jgi:hypothetical protein
MRAGELMAIDQPASQPPFSEVRPSPQDQDAYFKEQERRRQRRDDERNRSLTAEMRLKAQQTSQQAPGKCRPNNYDVKECPDCGKKVKVCRDCGKTLDV